MKQQDLFKLALGVYELTDDIDNYHYTMKVSLTRDGERCYTIKEKGSISSNYIFMIEGYVNENGGYYFNDRDIKYKIITAMSDVGGLSVRSNDTYHMLYELKFIPRGSFQKFLDNTKV
jgi:hypothetical protein